MSGRKIIWAAVASAAALAALSLAMLFLMNRPADPKDAIRVKPSPARCD